MDISVAKLPKDFDLTLDNKFNESEFKKILSDIIENLIEIARKNDKIAKFLKDYVSRVKTYVDTFDTQAKNIKNNIKVEHKRNKIKSLIKTMFKMSFQNSQGGKKEFSQIYNIFYPIILYQYLVDKKFIKDIEKRNLLKGNLKFSISSPDQRSMMMGPQQQPRGNNFSNNSWNVLNNLMEMLYGKMNSKIDKNTDKIESITYMYPLYINVVETVHSLSYFNLYHSCYINTTVGEYKNFTSTLLTACSNRSQRGGASRTQAIMSNPCDEFRYNTQGVTTLLSSKQPNDICKITRLAKKEFAEKSGNNKKTNSNLSPAAANTMDMISLLTDQVACHKIDDTDPSIYEDGFCDYDPFWTKLLILYFDVAQNILDIFISKVSKVNKDDKPNLLAILNMLKNKKTYDTSAIKDPSIFNQ